MRRPVAKPRRPGPRSTPPTPLGRARSRPTARAAPKVYPAHTGPAQVEIVVVGRELLAGRVADANGRFLAATLSANGARVRHIAIVEDDVEAIARAVLDALSRNPNIVLTTGGLGPAPDDRTVLAVSRALGRPLGQHAQAQELVEAAYERMAQARLIPSAAMNETREKLCRLPVGAIAVPNASGVAPGVVCRVPGGTAVICLPGDPAQARAVLEQALLLVRDVAPRGHRAAVEIESPTTDESALEGLLRRLQAEHSQVIVSSRPAPIEQRGVHAVITLEAAAATPEEAETAVAAAEKRLLDLVSGAL